MRERARVVRFTERNVANSPPTRKKIWACGMSSKTPPVTSPLSHLLPSTLSLSLSLSASKLKRGKNTSLLFLPIFDSALLEIRGGEGEANEIWVCAFANSRCTVRERTCYLGVESKSLVLGLFYFNWIYFFKRFQMRDEIDGNFYF